MENGLRFSERNPWALFKKQNKGEEAQIIPVLFLAQLKNVPKPQINGPKHS